MKQQAKLQSGSTLKEQHNHKVNFLKIVVLFKQILDFTNKHNLLNKEECIILGLSGGPDSVLLFHFLVSLHKAGTISLIAAHLNHEWRETATRDEEFCRDLCAKEEITFVSKKLSELPTFAYNGSKEEVARKTRRFFFEQLAEEYKADKIALAHHAQDQQETFFIRLLRGTSLAGLVGMKAQDGRYIRPLLEQNKADIVRYLDEQGLDYCIDETNESDSFLRNRIRKNVLPALLNVDTRFDNSFATTLQRLRETEEYLEAQAKQHFASLSTINNDALLIDYKQLLELHPVMRYRCIVHWLCTEKVPFPPSQAFFDELIRFLQNTKKEHQLHHMWKVIKINDYARIIKTQL